MKIHVIAIGTRMPYWVNLAFSEYTKRLPREFSLHLTEVSPLKHSKKNSDISKIKREEGQRLLEKVTNSHIIIVLDKRGEELSSIELAKKLNAYHIENVNVSLLIGGPEGLSSECLEKAQWVWSLSKLTLPHAMIRVILAEQIYRAWSIISRHPYHR